MKRPILPLVIALIAGIATGESLRIPDTVLLSILLISLSALLVSFYKKWKKYTFLLLIFAIYIIGILNMNLYLYRTPRDGDISYHAGEDVVTLEGVISQNPHVFPHKTDLIVAATRIITNGTETPVHGTVLLSVKAIDRSYKYGDVIRVKTKLKKPHNFNNPGGFDYVRYLLFRDIRVRSFVDNPGKIALMRENGGSHSKIHLERFRTLLRDLIARSSPGDAGKILQALILGEKGEMPEHILENFNRAGISHILAISGLHIGIIAFLSVFLMKTIMKSSETLFLRFNIMKISALVAIVPIMGYAFVAGFGISTIRATIMILTFLVALLLGRERDLLNALGLAAFIILIVSPVSLFDVSFQLSFTAVAAILIITPRVATLLPRWNSDETDQPNKIQRKMVYSLLLFTLVSLSATLGTFPLVAFYFNRISTVTLLSNILIIPIIGFIVLPLAMVMIAVAPFSSAIAVVLIKIASFFVNISASIIHYLASFKVSSYFVSTPTPVELALYYAAVIMGVMAMDRWREEKANTGTHIVPGIIVKTSFILLIILLVSTVAWSHVRNQNSGLLRATVIDVGHGSATLVEFDRGATMLVDGGGFYYGGFDVGKYIVAPFLWHKRIKKIDIVVLTHPHQDHLNGLLYILDTFTIGEIWTNGKESTIEPYRILKRTIAEKGIPHRVVSATTPPRTIDGAVISVLNPDHAHSGNPFAGDSYDSLNNDAIVMKISFGKTGVLLPSDILASTEQRIVTTGENIQSNILLVPHHGASTASTMPFLERVKPEYAVISCDTRRTFRNLRQEVLERYGKVHAKILRTDVHGAITMATDGKHTDVTPHVSRNRY